MLQMTGGSWPVGADLKGTFEKQHEATLLPNVHHEVIIPLRNPFIYYMYYKYNYILLTKILCEKNLLTNN